MIPMCPTPLSAIAASNWRVWGWTCSSRQWFHLSIWYSTVDNDCFLWETDNASHEKDRCKTNKTVNWHCVYNNCWLTKLLYVVRKLTSRLLSVNSTFRHSLWIFLMYKVTLKNSACSKKSNFRCLTGWSTGSSSWNVSTVENVVRLNRTIGYENISTYKRSWLAPVCLAVDKGVGSFFVDFVISRTSFQCSRHHSKQ